MKRQLLYISLGATLTPTLLVFIFTYLVSSDIVLSLALGGIATATDPAATIDVIREVRASGPLTQMLKSVVAIDDAWGIIIFSLILLAASIFSGNGGSLIDILYSLLDIGGSLLLGIAVAIPMSLVIGRTREGEPTLVEAMGFVFICGGLALLLELSYLLACMSLGATFARKAKYISRPFHEIEEVSEPFMIMFFLLSGLNLDLASLKNLRHHWYYVYPGSQYRKNSRSRNFRPICKLPTAYTETPWLVPTTASWCCYWNGLINIRTVTRNRRKSSIIGSRLNRFL